MDIMLWFVYKPKQSDILQSGTVDRVWVRQKNSTERGVLTI